MVWQKEIFSGNILLYEYLSKTRGPILLNRNLIRALHFDRQLLEKGSVPNLAEQNLNLRPLWVPPSWDALDEMVELSNLNGLFILDIHGVKPLVDQDGRQHPKRSERMSKARVRLQAKSTLQVSVISSESIPSCVNLPVQDATLRSDTKRGNRRISMETDPITFRPERFDYNDGQVTPYNTYKMVITILIDRQDDADELYAYLALDHVSKRRLHSRLSTTWENILDCPPGKSTLPLKNQEGNVDFGLEITMHWASLHTDSILTAHNRQMRAAIQAQSSQATPPLMVSSQTMVRLIFVYENKTITRSQLMCPHEGCELRKVIDIDDLRMHLDNWHDFFVYKATKQSADGDEVETWLFMCRIADHMEVWGKKQSSSKADDLHDILSIPPSQPFNQRRYLAGDNSYQQLSRSGDCYRKQLPTKKLSQPRRKPPDKIDNKLTQDKRKYPVPRAPPGIIFFRSCSRRPLRTGEYVNESDDEVDEKWITLRRFAEFDRDEQLSSAAKTLLKAFDTHMWKEQVQSDIHAGESLMRFTRDKAKWLWEESIVNEFKQKVDELLEDDIISKEVHTGCLQTVQSKQPIAGQFDEIRGSSHSSLYDDPTPERKETPPSTSAPHTTRDVAKSSKLGRGRARITETGHLTPVTADSDGDFDMQEISLSIERDVDTNPNTVSSSPPQYDLCLCGEDAHISAHISPLVACGGIDCVRKTFHYSCVRNRWNVAADVDELRGLGWVCGECRPRASTGGKG
ncbi:hypothetical protein GQ44DRAFT_826160 [Phaeosphaeriaceae sp. PMI808]|nr:hypothetical protein GQ44DRAFT_826160 [Phaeosphaeriaceae sp. PMI808]